MKQASQAQWGGALWGSVIGGLAATSMEYATHLTPFGTIPTPGMWSLIALSAIAGGALIGLLLGFAIGIGISEEDHFLSAQTMKPGQILLLVVMEHSQAIEAQRVISRSRVELKSQVEGGTAGD